MEGLRGKTIRGIAWSVAERFSVQGVQFLVMIIIARILSPSDYGLIGMLAIFIAVSDILIMSGFSQALIRKQNRSETDNSTVFYFNIVVSLFLYAILYAIAPWVSDFYNEPELCSIMRVMCISIVIFSFGVVQRAILTANIDFKTQTKASAISSIISGTAGVCMAYAGYGVWTLVSQQLLNAGLNTILLWVLSSWRPHLLFSWLSFRELFAFGSKLMLVGLLDTLYNNLFQLIIGKFFSSASLGFYSRARHFAEFPSSNISGVLQRVTYPVLCSIQNEDEKLAVNYRKILKMSAFIMFPLMIGLSAVAYPLIELLIGEKWLYAATLLVPICFSMMWYPINSINLSLLQVKGRTDLFLKIEIVKKILGLCILIATIPYGVLAMCYGAIVSTFLSLAINTYYTGVVIHVGFIRQMLDLMPTIVVCGFMFCIVTLFLSWTGTSWLSLISAGLIGAVSYFSVVMLLKFDELHELILIIRKDKGK